MQSLLPVMPPHQQAVLDEHYRQLGYANALLKQAGDTQTEYALSGRLYLSQSGWLLLSVPNALGRGAFDALQEPGAELPSRNTDDPDAVFNAHITVMSPDDVAHCGGPDKITERGHQFSYTLGPVKSVVPEGWANMSKCWFIEVNSPALRALRKSYGLPGLPKGDHQFHITIGVRRKRVLQDNEVSKAA